MNEEKTNPGEIELETRYIVLEVPESTLEATVTARVWLNGEVTKVERTMNYDEVREAFKEAEDYYIPPDARFVLTERGKTLADRLDGFLGDFQW